MGKGTDPHQERQVDRNHLHISEALALTADRVYLKDGAVISESLKKRSQGTYGPFPCRPPFLDTQNLVHNIRAAQRRPDRGRGVLLRDWPRPTAWWHVYAVMRSAGITGPHANPKGLRHGFGIKAVTSGISLNMVQKWLGHAELSTTSI